MIEPIKFPDLGTIREGRYISTAPGSGEGRLLFRKRKNNRGRWSNPKEEIYISSEDAVAFQYKEIITDNDQTSPQES